MFDFRHHSFYFWAVKDAIERCTDNGILYYLFEIYKNKKKFHRDENEIRSLRFEDFIVYFYIFLGFCGFSVVLFMFELILGVKYCRKNLSFELIWFKFKYKKQKFAKVHQKHDKNGHKCRKDLKLNLKLLRHFRKKRKIISMEEQNLDVFLTVVDDIYKKMTEKVKTNDESYFCVFGEKVANLEELFLDF